MSLPGDDDQEDRGTGRNFWKTGLPSPALLLSSSPEMMGHPDLLPEVDVSALDPLMSSELVDQTEKRYVMKVKVSEWDGDPVSPTEPSICSDSSCRP